MYAAMTHKMTKISDNLSLAAENKFKVDIVGSNTRFKYIKAFPHN